MRYVEIAPGKRSSVIGFGCSTLCGSTSLGDARRAVATALNCGITHFDVAPSYGYGEAEKALGAILSTEDRDRYVIFTKFGVIARDAARIMQPLKPAIRFLRSIKKRSVSGFVTNTQEVSQSAGFGNLLHRKSAMTPASMEASVIKSIKRLKSDYIDGLLLHEPPFPFDGFEALKAKGEELKAKGMIRVFGMAFPVSEYRSRREDAKSCDVLQIGAVDSFHWSEEIRSERGDAPNVIYSILRNLPHDGIREKEVARRLQITAAMFPGSVLLCSMMKSRHIEENCKVFA